MKRNDIRFGFCLSFLIGVVFFASPQEVDSFSDDALFGGGLSFADENEDFGDSDFSSDDDFFFGGDDDLFGDDSIEEYVPPSSNGTGDLAHGTLFESGSIKIGGSFDMSLSTYTTIYEQKENEEYNFWDNLAQTRLAPSADAQLTVDARPRQTLRLFTKFGINFPYTSSQLNYTALQTLQDKSLEDLQGMTGEELTSLFSENMGTLSFGDWFYVKELFTDFSLFDRAFFRFGLHTVSWGTGIFFSPVSDMINTSSIDPENTSTQVNGSFNLRTQLTFPGTQNCLWFYAIPDLNSNLDTSTLNSAISSLQGPYEARRTALAVKGDLLLGDWEFGAGLLYKYQAAPKAMLTASGSIIDGKVSIIGECVWRYGADSEWTATPDAWDDKTFMFQGTIGVMYYWKKPQIMFMAQYYYDGNTIDNEYSTGGHNIAGTVTFGKIGSTDFTGTILGIFYLTKPGISTVEKYLSLLQEGIVASPYSAIIAGTIAWTPVKEISIGTGPYITFTSFEKPPLVALRLSVTLGGGKF